MKKIKFVPKTPFPFSRDGAVELDAVSEGIAISCVGVSKRHPVGAKWSIPHMIAILKHLDKSGEEYVRFEIRDLEMIVYGSESQRIGIVAPAWDEGAIE